MAFSTYLFFISKKFGSSRIIVQGIRIRPKGTYRGTSLDYFQLHIPF
jgi:hypothetical protein